MFWVRKALSGPSSNEEVKSGGMGRKRRNRDPVVTLMHSLTCWELETVQQVHHLPCMWLSWVQSKHPIQSLKPTKSDP